MRKKILFTAFFAVFCIATVVIFMALLKSCNKNISPEAVVKLFNVALNQKDIEEMLEYIEPTEAQIINAAISKINDTIGGNTLSVIKSWLPFLSDFTDLELWPEYDCKIISTNVYDNSAKVLTQFVNVSNDDKYELEFILIKIESKWYIQYASKK